MFLNIIILCYSAFLVISASANNAIPVQTYSIYQQNGFMSPTVSQTNNIQPYVQQVTDQNQLQQVNIIPSTLKQAILNKLFKGSPIQTTVDPNVRSYSTILSGAQNKPIPGNVVYNKVVVPAEHLKIDPGNSNIRRVSNHDNKSPRLSNKKKSKSRKRQSDVDQIKESYQENAPISDRHSRDDNNRDNSKAFKTNNQESNSQVPIVETNENANKNTRRARKRKNRERNQTTEIPIEEEIVVRNSTKPQRRRKKPKLDDDGAKNTELEIRTNKKTKPKEIKENVDFDITNDGMDNENRKTRNSKQEINDIQKLIPNTPKEITNRFFSNVNNFNNPLMSSWFANYENLYQSLLVNQPTKADSRPKRKNKPKKTRKHKKNKNSQNRNSSDVSSIVNVDATPSKNIYINERPLSNLNTYPMVETFDHFGIDDKNMKYSSNEIFKDGYSMSDFENRFDNGYYEGYIDDYFPIFTDSAAYTANNKEIILKSLNDNKYYYATDRIDTDFSNKYQSYDLTERVREDNEKNRHKYDKIQEETLKETTENIFDVETQFRSPPFLATPDFLTRQVDKSKIKPEVHYLFGDNIDTYVNDKSSSYSNAKTPYYNTDKHNRIKMKPKDVETVYAKSKVAAYGPVYIPEDTISAGSNNDPWMDNSFKSDSFQMDGTTYVLAKSLDYPEY